MNRFHKKEYLGVKLSMLTLCAACGSDFDNDENWKVEGVEFGTTSTTALDIDTGAASFTVLSGRGNGQRTDLDRSPTQNDYVRGFTMAERSDDPCRFFALYHDVTSNAMQGSVGFDRCNGSSGNFQVERLNIDFRTTGLAVCLNNARDKIKGFALIGRFPACILNPTATAPNGTPCGGRGPRSDAVVERTNCPGSPRGIDSDWERIVECPAGEIVTGIQLNHIASNNGRRMINGARAICHELLP